MLMSDEASVRSRPAQVDDDESSGGESEPNGEGVEDSRLSCDEEQNDDDDDDDVSDTGADRDQLEADVMKQLGLSL